MHDNKINYHKHKMTQTAIYDNANRRLAVVDSVRTTFTNDEGSTVCKVSAMGEAIGNDGTLIGILENFSSHKLELVGLYLFLVDKEMLPATKQTLVNEIPFSDVPPVCNTYRYFCSFENCWCCFRYSCCSLTLWCDVHTKITIGSRKWLGCVGGLFGRH